MKAAVRLGSFPELEATLLWNISEMRLSLTQACSWKCLLMLVSCMLLCIYVTATTYSQMSNEDVYDDLLYSSHRSHMVARRMYQDIDLKLAERRFINKRNNTCQTSSVHPAKDNEDLLKAIIRISNGWLYPLQILVPAVLTHLDSDNKMFARAIEANYRNKEILKGANILLSRIQPEIEESNRTSWSDIKELRSSNKTIHLFAFYKLFYCLRKDTKNIHGYLKMLRLDGIKGK